MVTAFPSILRSLHNELESPHAIMWTLTGKHVSHVPSIMTIIIHATCAIVTCLLLWTNFTFGDWKAGEGYAGRGAVVRPFRSSASSRSSASRFALRRSCPCRFIDGLSLSMSLTWRDRLLCSSASHDDTLASRLASSNTSSSRTLLCLEQYVS